MIKDIRNAIFDADDALRDGDIGKARLLLKRADALLLMMQKDERGLQEDGTVPALWEQATRVAGYGRSTLGGCRRVHRMHKGTDAGSGRQSGAA